MKPYCEIWHVKDHMLDAEEVRFPKDFRLVAKVHEKDAYHAGLAMLYGRQNTDVVRSYTATRPTRKNDVVIDREGRLYLFDGEGLTLVRERRPGMDLAH